LQGAGGIIIRVTTRGTRCHRTEPEATEEVVEMAEEPAAADGDTNVTLANGIIVMPFTICAVAALTRERPKTIDLMMK
jgi:hypothetical protein